MTRVLIVSIVAIILVTTIIVTRTSRPSPPAKSPSAPSAYATGTTAPAQSARYIDYSPQAYIAAASKKRVLYFYATWCPTCSVANQDFTANSSQIPPGVVVFRTDYDRESALKTKYGITYQHTFVQVDENGNELTKWNGGGLAELLRNLE